MKSLREIAIKSTTIAKIMENREKLDTHEILDEKITINDIEYCTYNTENGERSVWAYTVEEYPEHFLFAGRILSNIFDSLTAECGGDLDEAYKFMRKETLKIRLIKGKTKKGQQVTLVEVL